MICAWMETSSALIGSSQTMNSRLHRQRARDADALPLAAGELVRVARRHVRAEAHLAQEIDHHVVLFGGRLRQLVDADGLRDDVVHRHAGFRLEYGSWKMICIRRRSGRSWAGRSGTMSRPS